MYKVDGNAIGHGGSCGNTVEPIVPTPIMMQQVGLDGHTKIGSPFQILDRGQYDGPLIEAPNLIKAPDGTFILFFSSNCYSTTLYDISYATSANLKGPYTKSSAPLLVTGNYGLTAPGGTRNPSFRRLQAQLTETSQALPALPEAASLFSMQTVPRGDACTRLLSKSLITLLPLHSRSRDNSDQRRLRP